MVIGKFFKSCLKNKISTHNVEFRKSAIRITEVVQLIYQEYRTIKDLKKLFNKIEVQKAFYNHFIGAVQECEMAFNTLKKDIVTLTCSTNKSKAGLISFLEEEIKNYNTISNYIYEALPEKYKTLNGEEIAMLINFLIENHFIQGKDKNDQPELLFNPQSIIRKIEDLSALLLDACIVSEIAKSSSKRVIFVAAGHFHIKRISQALVESGHISKHKHGTSSEIVSKTMFEIIEREGLSKALLNPELEKFSVNIDEFFKNSQTLTKAT